MRTPILAVALGLGLAGCLVGDSGSPSTGGGGDDTGAGGGTDQGSNTGSNNNPTPKLDVVVDKSTLSTELNTSNMVTVTLQASGGFSGEVTLVASAVDGGGAPVPGWAVTLDKPSVTLVANGSATAVATVKIPSDAASMAGTIKVDATSSLGAMSKTSTVNVTKQLTVNVVNNTGTCAYPPNMAGTVKVASGTKIRFVNNGTANNITFHITEGKIAGLAHEQGATAPGSAYEQTVIGTTGTTNWYCHNQSDPGGLNLQATP